MNWSNMGGGTERRGDWARSILGETHKGIHCVFVLYHDCLAERCIHTRPITFWQKQDWWQCVKKRKKKKKLLRLTTAAQEKKKKVWRYFICCFSTQEAHEDFYRVMMRRLLAAWRPGYVLNKYSQSSAEAFVHIEYIFHWWRFVKLVYSGWLK